MTKNLFILATTMLAIGAIAVAQEKQEKPSASQAPAKPPAVVPLKLQIVVSRYQGDKKISSLPYTLSVSANQTGLGPGRTSLRMGAQIPIATTGDSRDGKQAASFQYKDLGTNIDCNAQILDDTHFSVTVTIEDTSVYGDDQGGSADLKRAGDHPAFRSFRSTETLILRDGQSIQYTTGTDKVSGEIVRVDLTVNVIK